MAGVLSIAAILTAGCGGKSSSAAAAKAASKQNSSGAAAGAAEVSSEDRTTTEPANVNVGLIMGPPSMGLGHFMDTAEKGETFNHFNFTVDGMDYSTLSASLNQGDYDIITVPSNIAAILYNNRDLQEQVKVISINNMGLLYIVTTDDSIDNLADLAGRTVYSIGEGGTPEFTFDYLLEESGLSDKVNFSFRSTPFEILNLLQEEENGVALLPQPFVEVAKKLVPGLNVPIDITEEWEGLDSTEGIDSVTTVSVVRTSFLEEHPEAVDEYLEQAKASTDFTNAEPEAAAELTGTYETFMNPELAAQAIPECNIVTVTGTEMKEKLAPFLKIVSDMNPNAVGGTVPDDNFYYLGQERDTNE